MVAKRTVMELTDDRFKIAENEDVLRFVSTVSSSAHSDVGIRLLEIGKSLPGVEAYCPSYRSCMYVVLHTPANRIFALAYGQRDIAFRVGPDAASAAVTDGAAPASPIGADWASFRLWDGSRTVSDEALERYALGALDYASEVRE